MPPPRFVTVVAFCAVSSGWPAWACVCVELAGVSTTMSTGMVLKVAEFTPGPVPIP